MKTQLKKSLSLFLAVLMVLSCWVWVAPTEAEAAAGAEKYRITIGYNLQTAKAGTSFRMRVYTVSENGTNGKTGVYTGQDYTDTQTTGTIGDKTFNIEVEGFPVFFEGLLDTGSGTAPVKLDWNKIVIGNSSGTTTGYDILEGGNHYTMENEDEKSFTLQGYSGENSDANTDITYDLPHIAAFNSFVATPKSMSTTLNKIGGADVSINKPTYTYNDFHDQYGVKWTAKTYTWGSYTDEFYVSNMDGGSKFDSEDIYYDATTGKIVAKANLQVSEDESDGVWSGYLVQKRTTAGAGGGTFTSTASVPFEINYQKYTKTFNGAGVVPNLNYDVELYNGSTKGTWSESGFYGMSMTNYPTGNATAKDANGNDAYTFQKFWTEPQPKTGKASYNEKEADFAAPISNEKFEEYKENGGTVSGKYITYNEKTYYNAGVEWSPTADKTYTQDIEYHGWWLSKDLTIKFYDIDGKFLGTETVKYGQDQDDMAWPSPTYSYTSGAYTYNNFNGTWVDINGDTIAQTAHTFTKDLILTPKYDTVSFDKTYTVSFINELNGNNLLDDDNDEYAYRTDLSNPNVIPADRTVPSGIINDLQYSYTFEGWSTQKPSSGNYHILLEDGDFNEAGTAIAINSDWIVRSDVTYYPVYRRHLRTYAVNFWFKDSTGAEISRKVNVKYGEILSAPTDYVPFTYAQEGYGYEFKNWIYYNASGEGIALGYNNSIAFTKENIAFTLDAVEDGNNVLPVAIVAEYEDGVPTPYTVTFNYKNDKGEDLTTEAEVKHGTLITSDTVNALQLADEYDDGEAMVHFTGNWQLVEGAGKSEGADVAKGSELSAEELLTFSPTSHVTFEAVYGNPEPFYTVTYIDGVAKFEERVLVDSNLPVWTNKATNDNETPDNPDDDFEEDIEYLPTKAATAQGYYTFQGWFDEAQTDATFAATNGNKYEATSKVTGNVTLYPQFKFSPYTYEIKFMSYDGKTQLAAGKFEYGQNIEMITAEANRAAQVREQDNTYTYSFIGWDKTVPTFCEGQDMIFIALYKPVYRYYEAKWYNSVLDGENWVADKSTKTEDDKIVETGLLATTKHTYNSKLYTPSIDSFDCTVTPPAGQSYVFAGWYYNDADGNAQPYVRGMLITAGMEFYATYKLTAKTYTVTTDVKGETEEYEVAANEKATAVPTPNAGYVDATKHDEFTGWVTKDADGNESVFDIATATITADITIYAKFTESEHEYDNEELVNAPTYYAKGEKKTWCSCDAKQTEKTAEIAMLTDTVKPTGTIYLGTQGSWSSTDEVGAAATDNDDVNLFANANTDLILTINDTGDVNALYNPSGIGKGIGVIQGFISKGVYSQDNQNVEMSEVVKIFEDTTENLNNTANYVVKLGEYGDLEEGATYVAYYYVRDKAGNVLNTKVRTAKFIYDNTAPVFTVEGDNNADKVAGTPTYCETATITGIEDGATLTVNGVAVANDAITWDTVDEVTTGTYEIATAGNYLVTVTDKAGNKTSKKFTVSDDHSYDVKEVLSTCTEDGYKTEICIVCGDEKDKVVYKATGHVTTAAVYEATCLENGYVLAECSQCDYSVKTEFEVDEDGEFVLDEDGEKIPVFPALGHDYNKVDGEIVYTVITEATCKTKGKEIATCKACGETTTREIAIDEDAHSWGSVKTLKATCTQAGKTYHTCKLCYKSDDVSTLPATGHVETQWVETAAATCGEAGVETLQCKKCKELIGAYVIGWVNFKDDIVLTDKYEVVLDEDGNEIFEIDSLGQKFYQCYELDENGDRIFKYETQEIPATGRHILAVSTDPTKTYEATADKEGQITRYCTQCGQEWTEKVDKIKKYTVKFVDEDGTTEIKTIADVVSGTTVEKTAVTEPTKANSTDGKYKYTFAGWKDANGNSVTLPIDVTKDITLKASYTQSTIIYTHQFKVPNTWVSPLDSGDGYDEFVTMMGAMGDVRKPVANPIFALADKEEDAELKKLYAFKFLGWSTTGAKGDITEDFTIKEDATFYAVFEAVANSYQVIFYNGTEYVWDTIVDGGDTVAFGGTKPTKAYDNDYHYTFDKWYSDSTLQNEFDFDTDITTTTRIYAGFTATAHSYDKSEGKGVITQAATCALPELTTYTCECGHKFTEQTAVALGHEDGKETTRVVDGVTEKGYECVRFDECGYINWLETTKYTVIFENENGVRLGTYSVAEGEVIDFGNDVLNPTKASDAENTYTFKGWKADDVEYTDAEVKALKIAKNYTFTAVYTATTREYRVTYMDDNNKTLQTGLYKYGDKIPAYTGELSKLDKAYDDTYHYEFTGWSKAAGEKVTGDTVIRPVYDEIKHVYTEAKEEAATCEAPGKKINKCECGAEEVTYTDTPALGHTDDINGDGIKATHTIVEPDKGNGYKCTDTYTCERCGKDAVTDLPTEVITITVYDAEGKLAVDGVAHVTITNKATDKSYATNTNEKGQAIFTVMANQEWNVGVTGSTLTDGGYGGSIGANDNSFTAGTKAEEEENTPSACSCSCHKTTFWGMIFRLFQKIIKLFTGKYTCCSDPDPKYN